MNNNNKKIEKKKLYILATNTHDLTLPFLDVDLFLNQACLIPLHPTEHQKPNSKTPNETSDTLVRFRGYLVQESFVDFWDKLISVLVLVHYLPSKNPITLVVKPHYSSRASAASLFFFWVSSVDTWHKPRRWGASMYVVI